jgi:uroporphyrin-III C-methyltransferase
MKKEFTQHFGQVIYHQAPEPQLAAANQGSCTWVGVGSGAAERLTQQALHAIQTATVLLVDESVSEAVVALASPQCRLVRLGKRGGSPSTAEAFVDKLILHAVREGHQVVRLKGGDLRLGWQDADDISNLQVAGVVVSVVNGVSTGMSAINTTSTPRALRVLGGERLQELRAGLR